MSPQQIQSSKLKMTNRNLRTYRPLAPKPLVLKCLATTPLALKPLTATSLAPKPLTTPLATSPLTPKPKSIPLPQDRNFSDEIGVNSNSFMKYGTDTLMIPRTNEEFDYSLQENNQENYFHEEDIPIDILNIERESFNAEDLMVKH